MNQWKREGTPVRVEKGGKQQEKKRIKKGRTEDKKLKGNTGKKCMKKDK
jgi:hypothetical protein